MRIVIPDDYQDVVRRLDALARLAGHAVTVYRDTVTDLDTLAERFADALEAALRACHPGMAAVDVFAEEPLTRRAAGRSWRCPRPGAAPRRGRCSGRSHCRPCARWA